MVQRFGSVLFQEKTPAISEDWLRTRRNRIVAALAAAFLVIVTYLAVAQIQPPGVAPAAAPATEFSAARAMEQLRVIAARPHPTGSPENDVVRDDLLKQLTALGLDPQVQTTTVVRYESKWRGPAVAATVHNIAARLKGTGSALAPDPPQSKALMLAAHYDSVASGPGASDDGSGTATLLETARALEAGPPLKNDVIFLFTDAEELGMLGAQAFVEEHPWTKDVGLAMNFEARGTCGPVAMFETSDENSRLIDDFAAAAPHPVTSSLMYEAYKMLPNDTDLSVFKQAGMAGLNFAYVGCWPRYHTMGDSLENISPRSLQHDGDFAVALAERFGNTDLTGLGPSSDGQPGPRKANAIYFSLFGATIHYPARWALPLALIAVVLFLAALAWGARKGRVGLRGIFVATLLWPLAAAACAFLPQALWTTLRKMGFASLLPYGMAYNGGLYTVGFVALAVALFAAIYIFASRRAGVENLAAGALVWWALLELATVLLAPGATFVLVWPLLLAALALGVDFLLKGKPGEPRRALIWALPSAAAILLWVPLIYLLMELFETSGLVVITLLICLLLGLLVPYLRVISSADAWPLPIAASGIAAGFILIAMAASGFNATHARADNAFYIEDADTNQGLWASTDLMPDAWTRKFLSGPVNRGDLSQFVPLGEPFINSPAGSAELPPPDLKTLGDVTLGDERLLRLSITSSRQGRVLWVSVPQGEVLEGSVEDKPIPSGVALAHRGLWGFAYVGVPDEGITLALHVKAQQPLTVRVVDQTSGLPVLPGESFQPRPAEFMPAPGPFDSSTLVSKTFAFESRSPAKPAPANGSGGSRVAPPLPKHPLQSAGESRPPEKPAEKKRPDPRKSK
ncbi:MAG TPA: M20/M25/M40 family metallo-hydrolase [Terriglobia bacterium]|nr:M20/M25/M40 family metallo-hydrolase [Terriglobia bacterium]